MKGANDMDCYTCEYWGKGNQATCRACIETGQEEDALRFMEGIGAEICFGCETEGHEEFYLILGHTGQLIGFCSECWNNHFAQKTATMGRAYYHLMRDYDITTPIRYDSNEPTIIEETLGITLERRQRTRHYGWEIHCSQNH